MTTAVYVGAAVVALGSLAAFAIKSPRRKAEAPEFVAPELAFEAEAEAA